LWIFDADFENLVGDNAGWLSEDRSGTLRVPNYWHKDTIRINGFAHLGDSTWWCGTYDPCWRQPRGYGNDWTQILSRAFPEIAIETDPGDTLLLEFDQRCAIEKDYDYGYTDVSTDGGQTWTTVLSVDNPGFAGTPGFSQDWDGTNPEAPGHVVLDLSDYAGQEIAIRFRFESDGAYSSEDTENNPPWNSCLDGAWQLDNLTLKGGSPVHLIFLDDCESPGDNGWVHDDIPASGQTGVTYRRSYEEFEGRSGWMMAAYDSVTGAMVDGQYARLLSPPIDVTGTNWLISEWEAWIDLPYCSSGLVQLWAYYTGSPDCSEPRYTPMWPAWGPYWGGPQWVEEHEDWRGNHADPTWLWLDWELVAGQADSQGCHGTGFVLDRHRVGSRIGWEPTPTEWSYGGWDQFYDTYDLEGVFADSRSIWIHDGDGIASAFLLASDDAGQTWGSYPLEAWEPGSDNWWIPPPVDHARPATETWYYFEATDSTGAVSTLPEDAPDDFYEFTVLPVHGSIGNPGILMVDKHDRTVPGEDGGFHHTSEYYWEEALGILGYVFDVFDVRNMGSSTGLSDGPDTSGMKYYDTIIWNAANFRLYLLKTVDQYHLTQWLAEAGAGAERNLLLSGNNINYQLNAAGGGTLDFQNDWLATEFIMDDVGGEYPTLRDAAGDFAFMTYDDGACILHGVDSFDVIEPVVGAEGAERAVEYVNPDLTVWPGGVAFTHPTSHYQTVNLGFGLPYMMESVLSRAKYVTGITDRVDLMANIMEYFGKTPTGPPTGVEEGEIFANHLGHARPNPFNPATVIEYSVAADSHVTLRVYDLTGRVVRTLVDGPVEPGDQVVTWDGTTDAGQRAASGVYFVKMETAGHTGAFRATRKLVLLK
ncbi:MAG: FlgD immunoglobulin-like domain containing protein, partial [Candidatus Eisenbacteria bacterium]